MSGYPFFDKHGRLKTSPSPIKNVMSEERARELGYMSDSVAPELVQLPRYLNAFPDATSDANALRNLILEAAYVRVLEKASTKMIAPHGSWSWIVEAMEAAYNRALTMSDAEVLAASDSIQADWDRAVGNSQ